MRTSAKGARQYTDEAEQAFDSLMYDKDYLELTDCEKLLAALYLARDVCLSVQIGKHQCETCTRTTYNDWKGYQLRQIYDGVVKRLRTATKETERAIETGWKPFRPQSYLDERFGEIEDASDSEDDAEPP